MNRLRKRTQYLPAVIFGLLTLGQGVWLVFFTDRNFGSDFFNPSGGSMNLLSDFTSVQTVIIVIGGIYAAGYLLAAILLNGRFLSWVAALQLLFWFIAVHAPLTYTGSGEAFGGGWVLYPPLSVCGSRVSAISPCSQGVPLHPVVFIIALISLAIFAVCLGEVIYRRMRHGRHAFEYDIRPEDSF